MLGRSFQGREGRTDPDSLQIGIAPWNPRHFLCRDGHAEHGGHGAGGCIHRQRALSSQDILALSRIAQCGGGAMSGSDSTSRTTSACRETHRFANIGLRYQPDRHRTPVAGPAEASPRFRTPRPSASRGSSRMRAPAKAQSPQS